MMDHLKRHPYALLTNAMLGITLLTVIMLDDIVGALL